MEPPWLQLAYEEMRRGIQEIPGEDANPQILAYHRQTTFLATSDEVPWCAAFVCYCLERVNVKSTRSAAARSYLGWGSRVSVIHPPIGSIVVLQRGGSGQPGRAVIDAPGHVGFFWSHSWPGKFLLLGGNQGDRVSIVEYPVTRILGVRWPPEEG